jgi:hypothetical protein
MTEPCPHCSGEGRQFVHLNTNDPKTHGFQWIDCRKCSATGKQPTGYTARYENQRAVGIGLRLDRMSRGLTMVEEARRLGISVAELSRRERGYPDASAKEPTDV